MASYGRLAAIGSHTLLELTDTSARTAGTYLEAFGQIGPTEARTAGTYLEAFGQVAVTEARTAATYLQAFGEITDPPPPPSASAQTFLGNSMCIEFLATGEVSHYDGRDANSRFFARGSDFTRGGTSGSNRSSS